MHHSPAHRFTSRGRESIALPRCVPVSFPGRDRVAVQVMDDALSDEYLKYLMTHAFEHEDSFTPSRTNGVVNESRRSNTISGIRSRTRSEEEI